MPAAVVRANKETSMAQAKIEPGETDISLAGRKASRKQADTAVPERNPHSGPERKSSPKKKNDQPKASPLERGIDLG